MIRYFLFLLLISASLVGRADIAVRDARGKALTMQQPAKRIVSLAPHITELVFAVGAGEQLVGVVGHSDYPAAAREIPRVGSSGNVSYETVLSMNPDLVLAWSSGNGLEMVGRLESLGLPVYVSEPKTLADIADTLRELGELTGKSDTADAAAAAFQSGLQQLRDRYSEQESISVYYQIWDEPLMTLNGDHLISDVIRLCGGRNVFADALTLVSRISVESVVRADPQVIVASGIDESRPEWLDLWHQWTSMTAVKNDQLYFVPPDLLQRHTPRIVQGAEMFCQHLQSARMHYAAQDD